MYQGQERWCQVLLRSKVACVLLLKLQVTEIPFCTLWKSCTLLICLEKHPVNWKEFPPFPSLDGVLAPVWLVTLEHMGPCSPALSTALGLWGRSTHTHRVSSWVWSPCLSHSLFRLWLDTTHQSRSSIFSKKNLGILPQYCYDKRACPNKPGAPYWNVHFMPCI